MRNAFPYLKNEYARVSSSFRACISASLAAVNLWSNPAQVAEAKYMAKQVSYCKSFVRVDKL